ncbi:MAG: glycosyltransferase family 1 protein, partial [Muribaculaceae bacterium]|nr:glycosyltransferase family 1 protein [Muribaculaceae bacterium]
MKILFLGDYSNLHACLSKQLRTMGHEVTVVSDGGGHMLTHADFYIDRQPGKRGALSYAMRLLQLLPRLKGYDVVQLINPHFLKLRPGKIKWFFDFVRRNNRSVFLTLCGNDYYFVKACVDSPIFRFSEFRIGDKPAPLSVSEPARESGWIEPATHDFNTYLYKHIDGAMSVLPEYDMVARPLLGDKVFYTGLPIDLSTLDYTPINIGRKVRILVGMRPRMEIQKGTALLLDLCRSIERDYPEEVEVVNVKGLSLKDYLQCIRDSHIVIDQLYAYSPATNALQTMALGRVAATGAQPEYYTIINEPVRRPLIPLSPLDPDIKKTIT